jgi:hypothetical protein
MANLLGHAFQSGTITFAKQENAWAFRRLDAELRSGQENRIVFNPALAPVIIEPSPNASEKDLPWLNHVRSLLSHASVVYVQRHDDLLRFRQAIQQVGPHERIITLGTAQEVQHFAEEHWSKVSHFYATRREGFRFDFERIVTRDRDREQFFERIELTARLGVHPKTEGTQLTFDATGANVNNDLILWRKTVEDGQIGRFCKESARVAITVTNFKQPVTFCDEYHEDFKSHWYLFDYKTLQAWMAKSLKKRGS